MSPLLNGRNWAHRGNKVFQSQLRKEPFSQCSRSLGNTLTASDFHVDMNQYISTYERHMSLGGFHNKDSKIAQVHEHFPTLLQALPDQELVLLPLFWQWIQQRTTQNKESDEMNQRNTFPMLHACCLPCRVQGVLASVVCTDAKLSQGLVHLIWHQTA